MQEKTQLLDATSIGLLAVGEGMSAAELARILGRHRSTTLALFKRMERAGLIAKKYRSSYSLYVVTKPGFYMLQQVRKGAGGRNLSRLLTQPLTAIGKVFRWHHLLFRFPREDLRDSDKSRELVAAGFSAGHIGRIPGFWQRLDGWRVHINGESVLVYCPVGGIMGKTPYEAVLNGTEQACGVLEKVLRLLPWLQVSARYELCRQELALMGVTSAWVPEGYKYEGTAIKIDFSTGTAEVETFNRQYTFDQMHRLSLAWDAIAEGQ